jgi:hypothetical protein
MFGAQMLLFRIRRTQSGRRSHNQILNAVFLIAEHKRAAAPDAVRAPLQRENSPASAHSSRGNFPADIHLVPAFVMFIETLKVRITKWLLKL